MGGMLVFFTVGDRAQSMIHAVQILYSLVSVISYLHPSRLQPTCVPFQNLQHARRKDPFIQLLINT